MNTPEDETTSPASPLTARVALAADASSPSSSPRLQPATSSSASSASSTPSFPPPKEQLAAIRHITQEILSEEELLAKLNDSYKNKTPLRVKAGFDPSYPDLHLGHAVLLDLMSLLQKFGHQAVFVVGDFTAMIGDPSGRNQTRPILSEKQVQENARTYVEQVSKVLDIDKAEITYNSTWMKKMPLKEFIHLSSQYTVARMLEREDFTQRFKEQKPISIHEFFYPLMQAYDSYILKADLELGGTDQRFNLLMGREIQRAFKQPPQGLLMTPLLEGLDGVQKMSKSLGNHISLCDEPKEMFGKIMKLSDEMMLRYYQLLGGLPTLSLQKLKEDLAQGKEHPKKAKIHLAKILVSRFHSESMAQKSEEEFQRVFTKKELPKELPEFSLITDKLTTNNAETNNSDKKKKVNKISKANKVSKIWVGDLLLHLGWVKSKTEARRFIRSGAFYRDGNRIEDIEQSWNLTKGETFVLRLGKRKFMKIKVL